MPGRSRRQRRSAFYVLTALAVACITWVGYTRGSAALDERRLGALRSSADGANLVICVIDAARPANMSCYGYPRETTPNLDRLAGESFLFENHFSQATFSKASTASLFTSTHPYTHGILHNDTQIGLSNAPYTMAASLASAGFRTAFFSANPFVDSKRGMACDFQESFGIDDLAPGAVGEKERFAPQPLLHGFDAWLDGVHDQRFMAYLHLMPPHTPYRPPSDMMKLFRDKDPPNYRRDKYRPGAYEFCKAGQVQHRPVPAWINKYDSNMRYADWAIGEVISLLSEAGILDTTVFIVTSDHGEAFGEHGYLAHAWPVHDEVSRIPLVIRLPGGQRRSRVSALTQTIDLFPTVLDLYGVPWPDRDICGRSLLPLMAGNAEKLHDYVLTYATKDDDVPDDSEKYMVRGLDYSLLLYGNGEWRALYDMQRDPEQRANVINQQPVVAARMEEFFRSFAQAQRYPPMHFLSPGAERPAVRGSTATELTPQEERDLRALGYLR